MDIKERDIRIKNLMNQIKNIGATKNFEQFELFKTQLSRLCGWHSKPPCTDQKLFETKIKEVCEYLGL
jgi:hypothetical protein